MVVNVAMYIPAGITGFLAFRRHAGVWTSGAITILIAATVSAGVEMTQIFIPGRSCSALDLTTNAAGAIAGVLLAAALFDGHAIRHRSALRPEQRVSVLLLSAWLCWLWYPLMPEIGRYKTGHKIEQLMRGDFIDIVALVTGLAVWFALGAVGRTAGVRRYKLIAGASVLAIPLQILFLERYPAPSMFVGAIVGAGAFAVARPLTIQGHRILHIAQGVVFTCALILRGLAPFHLNDERAPFHWMPFAGSLNSDSEAGLAVLAEKFFFYLLAVWLWRAAGLRLRKATAIVAALLISIEIVQMWLPGRIAEIADPLIAIMAGILIAGFSRSHHEAISIH